MSETAPVPHENEEMWRTVLTSGHKSKWAFLPSNPRCLGCQEPFGGFGGRVMALMGHGRSRKNPMICNLCDEVLPVGGAEVDIGVLFADIRGSTTLAEKIGARAFAATLNRFYKVSTEVLLSHNAMIDKLVGDEVMALYIPVMCASNQRRNVAESAADLLKAIKDVKIGDEPLPIGIGVHVGPAFVGKIGTEGINDFTALGDTVNTAARLQAEAMAGQVALSDAAYDEAPELFPNTERRDVVLRGRATPLSIRIFAPD